MDNKFSKTRCVRRAGIIGATARRWPHRASGRRAAGSRQFRPLARQGSRLGLPSRPRLAAVGLRLRVARIRRPVFLPERRQASGADDLLEARVAPQKRRLRHPQHPQRHRLAIALQARHAVEHELGAAQGGAAQDFRRGIDAPVARRAGNRLQRIRNAGAIRRGLQQRLGPLAKILVARRRAQHAVAQFRRRQQESQRAPARARLRSAVCRRSRATLPAAPASRYARHSRAPTFRDCNWTACSISGRAASYRPASTSRQPEPSSAAALFASSASARSNCSRAAVQSPLSHVNQPKRCVRLGDFIVRSQRALGAGLRQLRERRLILAAETEIGDRQRCTGTREMRLMARERFQSFDDPRALRRAGTREALAIRAEQLQRIGEIGVVRVCVVRADQRHPVRRAAGLRAEKLRQPLGERADRDETRLARQLQLFLSLDDAVGRHQRERRAVRIGVERDAQRECSRRHRRSRRRASGRGSTDGAARSRATRFQRAAAPMRLRCAGVWSCGRPRAPAAAAGAAGGGAGFSHHTSSDAASSASTMSPTMRHRFMREGCRGRTARASSATPSPPPSSRHEPTEPVSIACRRRRRALADVLASVERELGDHRLPDGQGDRPAAHRREPGAHRAGQGSVSVSLALAGRGVDLHPGRPRPRAHRRRRVRSGRRRFHGVPDARRRALAAQSVRARAGLPDGRREPRLRRGGFSRSRPAHVPPRARAWKCSS